MGLTKPNNYEEDEIKFSLIASALGHPARKRIIDLIQEYSCIRNTDLPAYLNLHHATVTQHINSLKKSGLITCQYFVHFDVLYLDEEVLDYFLMKLNQISTNRI